MRNYDLQWLRNYLWQCRCYEYSLHVITLRYINKITFLSDSQPVSRNWPRDYTAKYIAFKLSKNKCYFHWHKPLLFLSQYSLCAMTYPLFIHSNRLIFLLEIKVVTFNHGINILYKVLKLNSKQLGLPYIHIHTPEWSHLSSLCNQNKV